MATETALITAEELLCLPEIDGRRELIDGRIVELAFPGFEYNQIMGRLTERLGQYVSQRRLGTVILGDVGVILRRNPDVVRGPDVCFIATERLPIGEARKKYLEMVPDLIVEIVSPTDTAAAVRRKVNEWLAAGARLVWTLFPDTRTVVVSLLQAGEIVELVYDDADTLTGAPVLPEFSIPVAAIFD